MEDWLVGGRRRIDCSLIGIVEDCVILHRVEGTLLLIKLKLKATVTMIIKIDSSYGTVIELAATIAMPPMIKNLHVKTYQRLSPFLVNIDWLGESVRHFFRQY